MLPKKLRTPIRLFPKNTKSIFSDSNLVIKTHPNNLTYNRLGVLISKQTLKNAAHRNKLKRKIINLFKNNLLAPNNKTGKDLLIILKAPIIKFTDARLKDAFEKYEQFI